MEGWTDGAGQGAHKTGKWYSSTTQDCARATCKARQAHVLAAINDGRELPDPGPKVVAQRRKAQHDVKVASQALREHRVQLGGGHARAPTGDARQSQLCVQGGT
jgi:hypothetical protein